MRALPCHGLSEADDREDKSGVPLPARRQIADDLRFSFPYVLLFRRQTYIYLLKIAISIHVDICTCVEEDTCGHVCRHMHLRVAVERRATDGVSPCSSTRNVFALAVSAWLLFTSRIYLFLIAVELCPESFTVHWRQCNRRSCLQDKAPWRYTRL